MAPLLTDPAIELIAPDLILAETANAFRTAHRNKVLSSENLSMAIDDLADEALTTVGVRPLLKAMDPLLGALTAYDACYLALAVVQEAPLATLDRQLSRAADDRDVVLALGKI